MLDPDDLIGDVCDDREHLEAVFCVDDQQRILMEDQQRLLMDDQGGVGMQVLFFSEKENKFCFKIFFIIHFIYTVGSQFNNSRFNNKSRFNNISLKTKIYGLL